MALINCELNIILTWSVNCVLVSSTNAKQVAIFSIIDTKRHVPVVPLSTGDDTSLLQ